MSRKGRECERMRQDDCLKVYENMTIVQKSYDRPSPSKTPPCAPVSVPGPNNWSLVSPAKRSISFLTAQELFSYKALPAFGVVAYLGTAIGTLAYRETFERWLGSDYRAINVINSMTVVSVLGTACYMYGRRHIRQASAFDKLLFPLAGSLAFNTSSHFCWAFLKELLRGQKCWDYHWRSLTGLLSGLFLLHTGRSYMNYIDYW